MSRLQNATDLDWNVCKMRLNSFMDKQWLIVDFLYLIGKQSTIIQTNFRFMRDEYVRLKMY